MGRQSRPKASPGPTRQCSQGPALPRQPLLTSGPDVDEGVVGHHQLAEVELVGEALPFGLVQDPLVVVVPGEQHTGHRISKAEGGSPQDFASTPARQSWPWAASFLLNYAGAALLISAEEDQKAPVGALQSPGLGAKAEPSLAWAKPCVSAWQDCPRGTAWPCHLDNSILGELRRSCQPGRGRENRCSGSQGLPRAPRHPSTGSAPGVPGRHPAAGRTHDQVGPLGPDPAGQLLCYAPQPSQPPAPLTCSLLRSKPPPRAQAYGQRISA